MIINCSICGKEFEKDKKSVYLSNKVGCKHYCSSECKNKKIKCNCTTCGKVIYKQANVIKRSKTNNFFCDKSCAAKFNNTHLRSGENNPNWQGGSRKNSYYANKAFRHYKNVCANCGYNNIKALEVHHIDKDKYNDDIDNLIILCANCHCLVHYDDLVIN